MEGCPIYTISIHKTDISHRKPDKVYTLIYIIQKNGLVVRMVLNATCIFTLIRGSFVIQHGGFLVVDIPS